MKNIYFNFLQKKYHEYNLYKTKKNKISINSENIHKKYLIALPKILQKTENIKILYSPKEFFRTLIKNINKAQNRIYLVSLYLEQDQGGKKILKILFHLKKLKPNIKIIIIVDFNRAHRNRIGSTNNKHTNADWYCNISKKYSDIDIPIYGVPINNSETLGVLHLKGFIIDDTVIYSGASLNNAYLNQNKQCRYDRYHLINNKLLAETMLDYINTYIINTNTANRLNTLDYSIQYKNYKNKYKIKLLRKLLHKSHYSYPNTANQNDLSIIPLVGLGKHNMLNQTIHHLIRATKNKITLCTPYFNIPKILLQDLIYLLNKGKKIEIIVGDKTANDFYNPENTSFQIINTLPYLYEINLRRFLMKLQKYIDNGQLLVRLWKYKNNGYHIKGLWIDNKWQLLTGNNLNTRAWKLDLENALLIHDPNGILYKQSMLELSIICIHTTCILHYNVLQNINEYPSKIRNLIKKICKIRFDRIINKIL